MINLGSIENSTFRISLYAPQYHEYTFTTPDCLFLQLTRVTPWQINCQDMKTLAICTRAEDNNTMFLDIQFLEHDEVLVGHVSSLSFAITVNELDRWVHSQVLTQAF